MARFYASIQGNRGEATRMGTRNSGITGHVRGWSVGARVECTVNTAGEDVVEIWLTSGSDGDLPSVCLGQFSREHLEHANKSDDTA